MKMKFFITTILLAILSFSLVSYTSAANNGMDNAINGVRNFVGGAENVVEDAGKGAANGIKNGMNTIENGAKNVTNGIENGAKDMTNDARGDMDRTGNNYTATRTSADSEIGNGLLSVSTDVWTCIF